VQLIFIVRDADVILNEILKIRIALIAKKILTINSVITGNC